MFISDEQWELLGPLLERPRKSQYGRPRAGEREVFEAILFVLHTGIQWKHLPRTFPPKSTVHDYLKAWSQSDAFRRIFAAIISQLIEEGRVNLEECFVDATFAAAKGGGTAVGLTRKGKGTKVQLVVDAREFPWLSLWMQPASVRPRWSSKPWASSRETFSQNASSETRVMIATPLIKPSQNWASK